MLPRPLFVFLPSALCLLPFTSSAAQVLSVPASLRQVSQARRPLEQRRSSRSGLMNSR